MKRWGIVFIIQFGEQYSSSRTSGSETMVIHVDMDAFYASVEMREQPNLRTQPVVVGGTSGRGVVAAANYTAREYGIHSAMPISRALRLCNRLVVVAPNFALYTKISAQIHAIFHRYTPLVESLSLDEAFLDVQQSIKLFGSETRIARAIQQQIKDELNLVASVGVAPNKFVAKIASDIDKPQGFRVVEAHAIQGFLDPLPVARVWGVGKVTQRKLQRLGIATIGQLRCMSMTKLRQHFANQGEHLHRLAHGIDARKVICDRQAKSISNETTFALDMHELDSVREILLRLSEQVARRLRAQGLYGKTISIKIRDTDFNTTTRAHTLAEPTHATQLIWRVVQGLFAQHVSDQTKPLRLVGVGVSNLLEQPAQQQTLFAMEADRQEQLDTLTDAVTQRFGVKALRRGAAR